MARVGGSATGKQVGRLGVLSTGADDGEFFYRWRRRLTDEMETSFVPLSILERATVEIELLCGATVKVTADRQSLQKVLSVLPAILHERICSTCYVG